MQQLDFFLRTPWVRQNFVVNGWLKLCEPWQAEELLTQNNRKCAWRVKYFSEGIEMWTDGSNSVSHDKLRSSWPCAWLVNYFSEGIENLLGARRAIQIALISIHIHLMLHNTLNWHGVHWWSFWFWWIMRVVWRLRFFQWVNAALPTCPFVISNLAKSIMSYSNHNFVGNKPNVLSFCCYFGNTQTNWMANMQTDL